MLGDLIPVMTGVAMAGRYLGQKIVTLTWIGDGGSSTGAFHEGLVFAAQQRAALVLVLENNQWAYSTPVSRQSPVKTLLSVPAATHPEPDCGRQRRARRLTTPPKARSKKPPRRTRPRAHRSETMRMKGHAQHDPAEYVPKEMFEYWKRPRPAPLYEKYLTENNIWDTKKKSEIDARIDSANWT